MGQDLNAAYQESLLMLEALVMPAADVHAVCLVPLITPPTLRTTRENVGQVDYNIMVVRTRTSNTACTSTTLLSQALHTHFFTFFARRFFTFFARHFFTFFAWHTCTAPCKWQMLAGRLILTGFYINTLFRCDGELFQFQFHFIYIDVWMAVWLAACVCTL